MQNAKNLDIIILPTHSAHTFWFEGKAIYTWYRIFSNKLCLKRLNQSCMGFFTIASFNPEDSGKTVNTKCQYEVSQPCPENGVCSLHYPGSPNIRRRPKRKRTLTVNWLHNIQYIWASREIEGHYCEMVKHIGAGGGQARLWGFIILKLILGFRWCWLHPCVACSFSTWFWLSYSFILATASLWWAWALPIIETAT